MTVSSNRFERRRGRAAALVVSTALGLLAATALWPTTIGSWLARVGLASSGKTAPAMLTLRGGGWSDEQGVRYAPYSRLRHYFPDNPRGYFWQDDFAPRCGKLLIETTRLNARAECLAQREVLVEGEFPYQRLTLGQADPERPYSAMLEFNEFKLNQGDRVTVKFQARSDAPKTITSLLAGRGQVDMPLQQQLEITPAWNSYRVAFEPAPTATPAHFCLNLAGDANALEIGDVTIVHGDSTIYQLPPHDERPAYFVEYRMNNFGFRGRDRQQASPKSRRRIAILGDSFAFGQGVHDKDVFAFRLEQSLNAFPATRSHETSTEVLNFAIVGLSTREERLIYEQLAVEFAPQVVVVCMCSNDNISLDECGRLREQHGDESAYADAEDRFRAARGFGWCVDELKLLYDSCQSHGARLAVFVFAIDDGDEWNAMYTQVRAGLEPLGVPVMTLAPALAQRDLLGEVTVHASDGHPNEIAHQVAAEELERFLAEHDLLAPTTKAPTLRTD